MASSPPLTKGAATRERILAAAITRFADQGMRLTSVAQIARDAGVTPPAVHAHFGPKESLFGAAFEADVAGVVELIRALAADPAGTRWSAALPELLAEVDAHPLARRVLAGREPEQTAELLAAPSVAALRADLTTTVAAGQRDGTLRADVAPAALYGALETLTLALLLGLTQVGPIGDADRRAALRAVIETGVRTVGP